MDPPYGIQYVVLKIVETQYPHLYQAGEVDGGALLDVELGGAEDGGNRLDDREVDPVLQVRGRRHLKILFVNDTASMTEVGYEDENCLKSTSVCGHCVFSGVSKNFQGYLCISRGI